MSNFPIPCDGNRVVITGRTGSGKTTLARYLLGLSNQNWVIFNPKHTSAFLQLPNSKVLNNFDYKTVASSLKNNKYTVINFSGEDASAESQDLAVAWLQQNFENIGLCIDELYTLHSSGGRAGIGLTGWLTRGREQKQSFLGLTQRPIWVTKFCFSEADFLITLDLVLDTDRKRLYECTGIAHFLERVRDRKWLVYHIPDDDTRLYAPVPVGDTG